jgi:alpha-1,2-mannosyltransferase
MKRPSSKSLGIALCAFLYLQFAYLHGWQLRQGSSVDFPSYWYAGVLTFEQDTTPYGAHAFDEASDEMTQKVHPYLYPPPSLLVWWPLAKMSFHTARVLFLVASHLCYLGAVWLLIARLTPLPANRELRQRIIGFAILYLFLFDPAVVTLEVGQINLITLLFLCLAVVAMRKPSPAWQIALPLSIAILLKTYPVLLLLPLVLRRRWSAAFLTCVFFGIYTAIAAVCLKPEIWMTWWREVVPNGGYTQNVFAVAGPWNQDINGFVTRLFLEGPRSDDQLTYPAIAKVVALGLALIVFAATMIAAFRATRRNPGQEVGDFEIAAFLLMIFLIAPISWDHHLVYILPAAMLLISLLVRGGIRGSTGIVIAAALFLIAWRLPLWEPSPSRIIRTLLISVKFYAAVVLWAFFVLRLWRPGPALAQQQAAA